ncbi:hypothetical protein MQC66_22860, partial [Escherichia coli]|nr:hypothetical protein [Escherichia coli]
MNKLHFVSNLAPVKYNHSIKPAKNYRFINKYILTPDFLYRSGELILTHFSGEPLAAHTIDHRLTMGVYFVAQGRAPGRYR